MQPEAPWGSHARWLTCILLDPEWSGLSRDDLCLALRKAGIGSRPVWKPLHLQPVYRDLDCPVIGGTVSETLFRRGLCLPSSSSLTEGELAEICERLQDVLAHD